MGPLCGRQTYLMRRGLPFLGLQREAFGRTSEAGLTYMAALCRLPGPRRMALRLHSTPGGGEISSGRMEDMLSHSQDI